MNTRPQAPSLPLEGFAPLNDTPVACQTREPTDPQGDRWHGEAVTDIVSRSRARERVSDGPISSNSGRNGGKNAGRNCVSALPQRAIPGRDLLRILADIAFHHRCRSKGLRVRSPARRLTRPLAPATAGVFRSYRHPQSLPLKRRTPQSLPPGGFAVLNDRPVACQTREPTAPQGDRCPHIPAALAATYPLRCFAPQWARFDNRQKRPAYQPLPSLLSAAAAQEVQAIPRTDNVPRRSNSAKPAPPNLHLPAPRQGILKP